MTDRVNIENELGAIMLKPDTHERGLETDIVRDINAEGYETIFQIDIVLEDEDIDWLYPDLCKINGVRERLIGYLSGKKVTLLAIRKTRSDITNPTEHLHDIKGNKLNGTGIRGKYRDRVLDSHEIEQKPKSYYFYMMVNNLHVFDSVEIFVNFLRRKQVDMSNLSAYLEA